MTLFHNSTHQKQFYAASIAAMILSGFVTITALLFPSVYAPYNSYLLSQARGQDLVTLFLILPAMMLSFIGIYRKSSTANFILAGGLGYLLYTYITYGYLMYCRLSLFYILIFAISLFGMFALFAGMSITSLPEHFPNKKTNKLTAIYNITIASLVALMWLKDLILTAITGTVPEGVILNQGASVIYANDLGFFLPGVVLASVLILKNKPWGFALTAVILIKEISIGAAIIGMIVVMYLDGQPMDYPMTVLFGTITLCSLIISILFFRSSTEQ